MEKQPSQEAYPGIGIDADGKYGTAPQRIRNTV
jgi:hypothetical protein